MLGCACAKETYLESVSAGDGGWRVHRSCAVSICASVGCGYLLVHGLGVGAAGVPIGEEGLQE